MRLTDFAKGGGCGCKWPADGLRTLLQQTGIVDVVPPELLVGTATADDAAVWRLNNETALIASVDFFSPIVDDGRDFGRIAAANALSDIYATGGTPLFALALAAMPRDRVPAEVVAEIFAGGQDICTTAGAVIVGGHTIDAQDVLYGLAVIGRAPPTQVLTNAGARIGDHLLLGKPLGIGILSAAHKRQPLPAAEYDEMVGQITALNRAGADLALLPGVHAVTDVTGFGLLGHLAEICRASGCGGELNFTAVPVIAAAQRYAEAGVVTGASARNFAAVADIVIPTPTLFGWRQTMLTDPQTGGGLLVACTEDAVAAVQAVFRQHGQHAAVIGKTTATQKITICP